jgi:ketosteroid isomerase-like protein
MTDHHMTIQRFWAATEARDWESLGPLLSADLVYEMEQTRERVRGRDAFLRFFREFPGDWHLTVRRVIADAEDAGVSVLDFVVGDETMTGITFFTFDADGQIARLEDVWPEPYERPASRAHLTEVI